jgi:2-keto-4-pentenoate hydratase/2-oxohepta-3-ene-1,7-dioic acid hydratase in catechol pathway
MRFVTLSDSGGALVAVVIGDQAIPMGDARLTMRDVVAGAGSIPRRGSRRGVPLASAQLGPVIPYPGAIYTVGENYRPSGESPDDRPARPLIYGKAPSSVGAPGTVLGWDRTLTANVDAECELGVVIGRRTFNIAPEAALDYVFGYTIVNDISSRDPWLDGDQWLLGKSIPGFCPVGPWIVTPDELDPADLRLGCTINGQPIQDGRTSDMRFSIAEIVSFLSHHMALRPGDLIATGTPARLASPPGPDRRLRPGDTVTAWIEGIGELTTHIV